MNNKTGVVSFNWDKYKTLFNKRVFVAGGLNPTNIRDLIKSHNPWGVDVSSGVEHEGEKLSLIHI